MIKGRHRFYNTYKTEKFKFVIFYNTVNYTPKLFWSVSKQWFINFSAIWNPFAVMKHYMTSQLNFIPNSIINFNPDRQMSSVMFIEICDAHYKIYQQPKMVNYDQFHTKWKDHLRLTFQEMMFWQSYNL